ncbi:gluconokinase [Alkalibacterium putridalgicola]|uniref:gluconokinase n=1 Tax=Alkalibacterium putridalgicola TaxID=426703 RepID=UPI0034CD7079
MSHYSIGADIGTTSTKAVLFSSKGDIVHQATVEYPLLTPEPKAAEQDPDEIVEAVVTAIQSVMANSGVDKKDITVLSFSAAMHSLIAVDAKGKPLTKSLTWADQRAEPYARQLKETNGKSIYDKTGTPIHPMSPLTKLMWLKAEQPDIFNKASRFIGIKEYVFNHFFNKYVVDHSIASATGLLNMYELDWDKEALETAGVTKDRLSELVPTTAVFTDMDPELAERMGIHPDMKVVIGANDGCLANLGVNAIENGVVAVSIGTSGAIRTVTDKPVSDPKGRIFCYALTEDHWVIGGPVNNGGMILRWLRDELCAEEVSAAKAQACDPYDLITEKIAKISAGSNGLLFHPYLSGERAPSWNANARGSFYGLAMHHKRDHMMRAVLEGINMNLYMVLLALEEVIGIPDRIHATGGFAKSPVWRQMMANIFNQEVHVPQTVEGACLGAAVLGKYAIGEIDDLTEVRHMVETKEITVPEAEEVAVYEELMPLYIRLSRLFEEEYEAITAFQQKHK